MKNLLLLITLILFFQSGILNAATMNISKSNVEFVAKGFPSFLKIKGKSQKLVGSLEKNDEMLSGQITLDLNTLDTGIELRDEHMKKNYLNTGEFQTAVVTLMPFKPSPMGTTKATLKLRNVEKEIDVNYELEDTASGLKAKTNFEINITDFKIPVPEYQGITVAKTVKLNINLEANKK